MAEIVKYVYVIIIFPSLILFATNIEAIIRCFHDADCVHKICHPPQIRKCVSKICKCRLMITQKDYVLT
ncbi:Nodule Cysteine-Rich (NCR) secreted peptide [Medicago truncatula]|uniref:Nodule Cysteine-Rich (NCR) secreted peptide n=2 Tax=Medicago truncatula TaxID=3880 RepID=G7KIM9_MEDTR|nr:Nodule Cysteine-Rich (NCR) secreted peptide [Medicago truncatula]